MKTGRPWKYKPLIDRLEDSQLYHVGKIIQEAKSAGLFEFDLDEPDRSLSEQDKKRATKNARSALANKTTALPPPDGEIEVTRPYKSFYRAWLGSTWKKLTR